MKKKTLIGIISISLMLSSTSALADEITMYLNGSIIPPLQEGHQPAIVQDGTLYLPMRNVFEAMGATVEWDGLGETVSGGVQARNYKTTAGSYKIVVNNEVYEMSEPTIIVNDRTLIVPEAVINCFGASVDWDAENSIVQITYDPDSGIISTVDFTDLEVE